MIRTIIVLIILSICVIGGYYIQTLPYYVRVYDIGASLFIEIPLLAWVLLSLACAFVLGLCFKSVWFIWRSPKIFSRNAQVRREYKANQLLRQGFEAMSVGDYRRAEKKLVKGGELTEQNGKNPVLYYENAAIAADRQNANERRDTYFKLARHKAENQKDTRLTSITEAETLVANGEYTAAVKLLEPMQPKDPRNSKILNLLDECYCKLERWQDAWQNLRKLRNYLSNDEFTIRKKTYARGMLRDTSAIETYEQLQSAWRQLPTEIRAEKEMLMQYASSLVENGHSAEAEKLLSTQIKTTADIDLVQAYSQLRGINFKKALSYLNNLEPRFIENATFQYCKALIAYRAQEFAIANTAIESSIKLQKTPEAFALWGQILEASKQPEAALAAYHQSVTMKLEQGISGEWLPALQQTPVQLSQDKT